MNGTKKPTNFDDSDGLFIPNRQLSFFVSGAIAAVFCVFMGGYFVGKNHMLEPLMMRVEDRSFADQVYTSLYARYEPDLVIPKEQESDGVAVAQQESTPVPIVTVVPQKVVEEPTPLIGNWYAPLVGYPNEQSAVAFRDKLARKGIATEIKKHPSTTPKGKKKYWYQVVTASYTDRAALARVVDKIAKEEKIKDIKIMDLVKA